MSDSDWLMGVLAALEEQYANIESERAELAFREKTLRQVITNLKELQALGVTIKPEETAQQKAERLPRTHSTTCICVECKDARKAIA